MNFLGLNEAQVIYIVIIVGGFGIIYGRRFYKEHKKKQEKRQHWKNKWTK